MVSLTDDFVSDGHLLVSMRVSVSTMGTKSVMGAMGVMSTMGSIVSTESCGS